MFCKRNDIIKYNVFFVYIHSCLSFFWDILLVGVNSMTFSPLALPHIFRIFTFHFPLFRSMCWFSFLHRAKVHLKSFMPFNHSVSLCVNYHCCCCCLFSTLFFPPSSSNEWISLQFISIHFFMPVASFVPVVLVLMHTENCSCIYRNVCICICRENQSHVRHFNMYHVRS